MISLFIFTFGLIIGSFLGAFTYRSIRKISIAKGRSFCPNCKKQIAFYDNIPLFSYIFLKGKCRNCKEKISLRYPLIEFSTGLAFLISFLFYSEIKNTFFVFEKLGFFGLPILFIIISIFVCIFVIDIERQIIFDELVFFGFILVLFIQLILGINPFPYLFSSFFLATIIYLLNILTFGKGMGLGDVKLVLFSGIFLAFPYSIYYLVYSFIVGGIYGVFVILSRKNKLKDKVAFAPFLILGLIIYIILKDKLYAF